MVRNGPREARRPRSRRLALCLSIQRAPVGFRVPAAGAGGQRPAIVSLQAGSSDIRGGCEHRSRDSRAGMEGRREERRPVALEPPGLRDPEARKAEGGRCLHRRCHGRAAADLEQKARDCATGAPADRRDHEVGCSAGAPAGQSCRRRTRRGAAENQRCLEAPSRAAAYQGCGRHRHGPGLTRALGNCCRPRVLDPDRIALGRGEESPMGRSRPRYGNVDGSCGQNEDAARTPGSAQRAGIANPGRSPRMCRRHRLDFSACHGTAAVRQHTLEAAPRVRYSGSRAWIPQQLSRLVRRVLERAARGQRIGARPRQFGPRRSGLHADRPVRAAERLDAVVGRLSGATRSRWMSAGSDR